MSFLKHSIKLCSLLLCVGLFTRPASAQTYGVNLLVNGDAEANAIPDWANGTETGVDVVPFGWTRTYGAIVPVSKNNTYWAAYGAPFFVKPGAGITSSFFVGGHASSGAQMYQVVNVSSFASAIDQNLVRARIDARIGTYTNQTDGTIVSADYYDSANNYLGSLSPGEINNNIYNNPLVDLDLNFVSPASALVPVGTRNVVFFVTAVRHNGSDDDSYVDDISFQLLPRIAAVSTGVAGSHWEEVTNSAGKRIKWKLVQDVVITNTGNVDIQNLRLTNIVYGTHSGYVTKPNGTTASISTSVPLIASLPGGVLTAGASITLSVPYLFANSANLPLVSGSRYPLRISGDYTDAQTGRAGSFSQTFRFIAAP